MLLDPSSEAAICPITAVVIGPPDPGITPAAGIHLSARLCGGLGGNTGIEQRSPERAPCRDGRLEDVADVGCARRPERPLGRRAGTKLKIFGPDSAIGPRCHGGLVLRMRRLVALTLARGAQKMQPHPGCIFMALCAAAQLPLSLPFCCVPWPLSGMVTPRSRARCCISARCCARNVLRSCSVFMERIFFM